MRQMTGRRGPRARKALGMAMLVVAMLAIALTGPAVAGAIAPPSAAPVNTAPPALTGTPAVGQTLSCSNGSWANSPTSFSYAWLRNGVPIAGQSASTYVVQAADQGASLACRVSASNGGGNYTIVGLPSGSYAVSFFGGSEGANYLEQYYNGKNAFGEATPVSVTAPNATGAINAELHAGGQITGKVTDAATHAAIANIFVCADEPTGKFDGCAVTNASGEYAIAGLPSGSYTVEFSPFFNEEYLTQFYSGKSSFGEAQAVGVTAGSTTPNINAELQPSSQGGQITGTVTDTAAKGLAKIEVCAFDTNELEFFDRCTETGTNGEYALSNLPAAQFYVYFSAEDCQSQPCTHQNYVNQYYKEAPNFSEATLVNVAANTTTPAINGKLIEGGKVAGRVTAAVGEAPLANVEVCASEEVSSNCAETDANGQYTVEGLAAGSAYSVSFYAGSSNYIDQVVSGQAVTAGATTTVNAKLLEGGVLGGRVTDAASHAPLAQAEVCAESGASGGCSSTNANGEYQISKLETSTYAVSFYPASENNDLPLTTQGVSVTAGQTSSLNGELQPGGVISGRVTDAASHLGIANIEVCATEVHGGGGKCAVTSAGTASTATATSNSLAVPGSGFSEVKRPVYDAKHHQLDFFFKVSSPGVFRWALFFRNSDVGFADSLGLSFGETSSTAEAARKSKKSKRCKKGTTKHRGKCVKLLVSFGSGSQTVKAAGTVEVKVKASAKAIKALDSGRTLHVSGSFTFQAAAGGKPVTHTVTATVRNPPKKKHRGKGHHKR